jgi:predicted lipid-binding transport protein (Tim44 family)
MVQVHEIDRIADLSVTAIDLVNVRYTTEPSRREFTALISARARDYYVDDRTQEFLRGDTEVEPFQEFWTFQWNDGAWRLREIEQTKESDVLKQRNFFEPFTDARTRDLYKGVGGDGPAGPWTEETVESKDTRIERLLNFLAQNDKLWDRESMRERARSVFLDVYVARETGDPAKVPEADLFPTVAESLRAEIRARQAQGMAISFRNLCVRKVDLVLVRNYSDNTRDTFTARLGAHAQVICSRNDAVFHQQDDVTPFEEFWTFGRLEGQWKLQAVEPPARGRRLVGQENVDEGVSADQLQWYYKQPRPGEPEPS